MKGKKWLEIATTFCLLFSAYAVSEAGHYGAQLTNIERVEVESAEHNH